MGMSYLIDTHIFLWWLFNDSKLDTTYRDIIRNPDHRILVSSASAWEIATKYRIGKLPEAKQLVGVFHKINDPKPVIAFALGVPEGYEAKQSQGLGLLRFARNDNWAFFYLEYS